MTRRLFRKSPFVYLINVTTGVNIVTTLEVLSIKKFAVRLSFLKDKTTSIIIMNNITTDKPSTNQHQNDVQHEKSDGNASVSSVLSRESGVSAPTPYSSVLL